MSKSEDLIQQESFVWFWNTYPKYRGLLFHVPNGGHRNAREGRKFKLMGVTPGVSDLIFLFKGSAYLLECKTDKGSQSKSQKKWQKVVEEAGFEYHIFRSLEEFKIIINGIIYR